MNPKKFGGLANHKQESWKVPLPQYIEHLYEKQFGKPRPDSVLSIEESSRKIKGRRRSVRNESGRNAWSSNNSHSQRPRRRTAQPTST